jgi:hypothetical protein
LETHTKYLNSKLIICHLLEYSRACWPEVFDINPFAMSRQSHNLSVDINILKPTGHVMHQQFNIQQLYVLPTLYLCVLYLSENKQRLVPLTA